MVGAARPLLLVLVFRFTVAEAPSGKVPHVAANSFDRLANGVDTASFLPRDQEAAFV
jgi:hypothetical protein